MGSAASVAQALCEQAQRASDLLDYRRGALALIGELVRFDAALFHELSPRVPLSRAVLLGLDANALARGQAAWDENAVLLGRLRDLAIEQGGVATDRQAFPESSRGRRAWEQRVARPLGVRSMLIAHLSMGQRIISAILLFRRDSSAFERAAQEAMRQLVPALSLGDAAHQYALARELQGPRTRLACVDQRLTARQREVVERVALGHTNLEIGAALGVSANTVRNLLTEVRKRLGAANRAEIVRIAVLR
jgi:DNA-binding CsgD family transcriptional regulator